MVGGSDGVRAKTTGALQGGMGQGYLLCLPVCAVVVGGYETSLLMSPTVEDGSFVW